MTSAVSTIDGTGTVTAAHRHTAPIWPFHTWIAWTLYAFATAGYKANQWETRFITTRPLATALIALAGVLTVLTAISALVVNA